MYAIVEIGGNQYRVAKNEAIVVDRLVADVGKKLTLRPLFYRGEETLADQGALGQVKVQARVVGHERGTKVRVLNFKPKGGHRRHVGHRSEQTRLLITDISVAGARKTPAKSSAKTPSKTEGKTATQPRGKSPAKSTQRGGSQAKGAAKSSERQRSKPTQRTSKDSAKRSGSKSTRRSKGTSDGS